MINKRGYARFGLIGCNICLIALSVLLPADKARAGFEWTPPPAPVVKAEPVPPVSAAPVIEVEEVQAPALPVNPFMEEAQDIAATVQEPQIEQKVLPVAAPIPAPQTPQVFYDEVVGFGSDIPLVLAMQQIVPPDYSYSFDEGINQGVRVAWNGGRPWNEVLEDAVSPHDVTVVISEKTVWLRHSWSATSREKVRLSESSDQQMPEEPPVPAAPALSVGQMPPVEPIMAVNQAEQQLPEPQPIPMALAVMEQEEQVPAQSYPRRNPIPFMMKHGHEHPDVAKQVEPVPVVSPTPLVPSPFAENIPPVHHAVLPENVPPPVAPPVKASEIMHSLDSESAVSEQKAQVMDPFEIRFWHAEPGDSLKEVLSDWTSQANVAILWNSAQDYAVPSPVRMHGTFPDAVTHILMYYNQAEVRPLGRLHPNLPNGPSVLIVENYNLTTQ